MFGNLIKFIVLVMVVLILGNMLMSFLRRLGVKRIPGDFVVRTAKGRYYMPLGTSIILSLILTALVWLLGRIF